MDFLQKFWKAILIVLAITLMIVLISFLAYVMQWSLGKVLLVILAVGLGVFSLWGGYRLWRWYKTYCAEKEANEQASPSVQRKFSKIEAVFKHAVARIKKSKLRAKGNPLYVLPWYLLIGAQGVGKTTALKNSRVSIPLLEGALAPDPADDLGQWWLMEESIVIESPSRYIFEDDAESRAEWQRFMAMFKKYRRWQPLNGLVVALPADRLLTARVGDWHREAETLRLRIAELVKNLGVRIPVYFMVTQIDRLAGAVKYFERFPESVLSQAMGVLVHEQSQSADIAAQVDAAMRQVTGALNRMRNGILASASPEDIRANELVFPEDVAAVGRALKQIAVRVFDKNFYEEPPLCRGIYFTSGHQEGLGVSTFEKDLPAGNLSGPANAQERSYFLRGFLGTVLKQEKTVAIPTKRAVAMQTLQHNLGLVAWVGVCILLGLAMTGSFFANLRVINTVAQELPSDLAAKNKIDVELANLSAIRTAVMAIEKANQDSWLTRTFIGQSKSTGKKMAAEHNRRYNRLILETFEPAYGGAMDDVVTAGDPSQLANYIDFMTRRIKLAQLAQDGDVDLAKLLASYQPNTKVFRQILQLSNEEIESSVAAGYTSYIYWSPDKQNENLIKQERTRLESLLKNPEIGLSWLIQWANMQPTIEDVTTRRYWDVDATGERAAKVPRAFTPEGWNTIRDFLVEVEKVVNDKDVLAENKKSFMAEYRGLYFLAWREYMAKFDSAATAFIGKDKRQKMAVLITGKDTPYLKFMNDLPTVLAPVLVKNEDEKNKKGEELEPDPSWVELTIQFAKMSSAEYQEQAKGGNKMVAKLVKKGASMLGSAGKLALKATKKKKKKEATEDQILTVVARYQENIGKLGQQTKSNPASFEMAKTAFAEAGTVAGEPQTVPNKLDWDLQQLEEMLGEGDAEEDVVWKFLRRQFELTWGVVLERTAQHLQQVWQDEVLTAGDNLSGWAKIDALQGEKGKVWEFQNSHLASFVKKTRGGMEIKRLYNTGFAFTPQMVRLLSNGKVGAGSGGGPMTVNVGALPTGVNPDADVKPHLTKLVLQCGAGNIELDNYNYPIQKKFNWNPADCADVVLQIYVGDVVCERKYTGFNGFNDFMKDFRGGPKTYRKEMFPAQAGRLAGYRVKSITVGYQFSGQSGSGGGGAVKGPTEVPERMLVFID
ncbi:MAG: type VI secretion protein IcmF/TssM N-terminal domain-containing protein [Pseudomonadota bacterium]